MLARPVRIGMIKFARSRTELTIPRTLEPKIQVQVGQNVRGGADIIARLGKPIHTLVRKIDDSEVEKLRPSWQTPA